MEGQDREPVEPPGEPFREEDGSLPVHRASGIRNHLHLQPGKAREFHFGTQQEEPPPLESFYAPEVEHFTGVEQLRMPAAATKSHPADELVCPATQRPREWERVPPIGPSDTFDDFPDLLGRRVRGALSAIGEHRASRPVGVAWQRRAGCVDHRSVLPGRLNLTGTHFGERELNRASIAGEPTVRGRNERIDIVLTHNAVVL